MIIEKSTVYDITTIAIGLSVASGHTKALEKLKESRKFKRVSRDIKQAAEHKLR